MNQSNVGKKSNAKKSQIPPMLEVSLILTKIILLLTGALSVVLSLLAKATWIMVFTRLVVTLLVVGLVGWLLNWLISKFLIEATLEQLTEEQKTDMDQHTNSSMEMQA
jgi:hypothetical protein